MYLDLNTRSEQVARKICSGQSENMWSQHAVRAYRKWYLISENLFPNLVNPVLAIHSGEKHQVLKAGRYSSPDCYPINLVIDSDRLASPDSEPLKNVTLQKKISQRHRILMKKYQVWMKQTWKILKTSQITKSVLEMLKLTQLWTNLKKVKV